jgi:hypothetical protein
VRYSYESWASPPAETPSEPESPPLEQESRFAFSEDMKELEDSLSMGFSEGMYAYQQARQLNPQAISPEGLPEVPHWDALARIVADHVLAYLKSEQEPLVQENATLQRQIEEYQRDNRAMALQIQHLLDEKDQLQQSITAYQLELSRFRPMMGNMHLKV